MSISSKRDCLQALLPRERESIKGLRHHTDSYTNQCAAVQCHHLASYHWHLTGKQQTKTYLIDREIKIWHKEKINIYPAGMITKLKISTV